MSLKYSYSITAHICTLCLSLLLICSCSSGREYVQQTGFAQGSTYNIIYQPVNDSTSNIETLLERWFAEIDNSLSGYNEESLISRFNRGENPALDSIFIDNFNISKEMYNLSGGLFDASAGPLFSLWGFGFKEGREVTREMIDSVKAFVGMNLLTLVRDSLGNTRLAKADPRVELNFNAVAQGYTCDYIARHLYSMGLSNFLIEVGGEVFCSGVNRRGKEWRIGVDSPVDGNNIPGEDMTCAILLSGKGLVTSGNYRKFYIKDGRKFSHTIDPLKGEPVSHSLLSATIVAENATMADALATYCMVLGLEKSQAFLKENPQYEALLIYDNNGATESWSTSGLKAEDFR